MNLPDTNIWLALILREHTFHKSAREWFDDQPDDAAMMFCRATQQSLLRLLTTEAVMRPYGLEPMPNDQAWQTYEELRADPRIEFVPESPGITDTWRTLASRATASPKLWMDAYLAAFAMTAGLKLVTTDGAFAQFKSLGPIILKSK